MIKSTITGGLVAAAILAGCTNEDAQKNDAMSVIAQRVSVRRYDASRQVPNEMIELLLRAAMAAPTANVWPWPNGPDVFSIMRSISRSG